VYPDAAGVDVEKKQELVGTAPDATGVLQARGGVPQPVVVPPLLDPAPLDPVPLEVPLEPPEEPELAALQAGFAGRELVGLHVQHPVHEAGSPHAATQGSGGQLQSKFVFAATHCWSCDAVSDSAQSPLSSMLT
jgi:hypothetical protein